jgi:hypothetical protein
MNINYLLYRPVKTDTLLLNINYILFLLIRTNILWKQIDFRLNITYAYT